MLRLSEGQGKLKIMYFWISSKLARSTGFFSNKGPAWKEITHALKDHHHGGFGVAMQLHAKKKMASIFNSLIKIVPSLQTVFTACSDKNYDLIYIILSMNVHLFAQTLTKTMRIAFAVIFSIRDTLE